jgi:hypothetical protein
MPQAKPTDLTGKLLDKKYSCRGSSDEHINKTKK